MPDDESEDVGEKEELEDEMTMLEAKVAELEKELQYSQAETANARQRGLRDRAEAIRFGAAGLASRIIPAIDSLEKAIANENSDNEVISFERFKVGEGIEVSSKDFAEEVAEQLNKDG